MPNKKFSPQKLCMDLLWADTEEKVVNLLNPNPPKK